MSATQKRWSYRQITASAEESIRRSVDLAKKAGHPQGREWHRACAYGIFSGWRAAVTGWIPDGEVERLEKLTQLEAIN